VYLFCGWRYTARTCCQVGSVWAWVSRTFVS